MKALLLVRLFCVVLAIVIISSAVAPVSSQTLQATAEATAQGTVQANVCQNFVQAALDTTNKYCADTGRNKVCYGSISIQAQPQPGVTDFAFDQPGQIVPITSIQELKLGVLDTDNQTWGVALFRIQANLPDTAPGQNVTLFAFGDVDIQNAVPTTVTTLDVTTNSNAVLRSIPTGSILSRPAANSALKATGRTADSTWLRVQKPDAASTTKPNWVLASGITTGGDISTLAVVDPAAPIYGPMQAFYLRTGVGQTACQDAPQDGILIQSPKGAARVNLSVNDVKISLGSTAFLRTQTDGSQTNSLALSTLEGSAVVQAGGQQQTVSAGYQVEVPLDANLKASGTPNRPHLSDSKALASLPVKNLPVPVVVTTQVVGTPRAVTTKTAGGSGSGQICPSNSPVVADYSILGTNRHVVSNCICQNGTHTASFSYNTPQGVVSVNGTFCN